LPSGDAGSMMIIRVCGTWARERRDGDGCEFIYDSGRAPGSR
jgi:hypothetical protein